jgi:hypothetical protein
MEDLIACLYPFGERSNRAHEAIKYPVNCSRFVEAKQPAPVPEAPVRWDRRSRGTTAPPDDNENEVPSYEFDPGLQLTFSHGPKGGHGFIIGTDPSSCDIVVPEILNKYDHPVISSKHLYISFDAQHRLFVQDTSSRGTIVTYDGKGGKKRRNFKWIIGGDRVPDDTKTIVIEIHLKLKFQIVVSKHHQFPDLFFSNVDQFLEVVATNNELPFGALGMQSARSTAAPSRGDTPNEEHILLKQGKLGEGSFSVVSRVWDVSTGLEYASKKILRPAVCDWENEVTVMRKISHVSIKYGFGDTFTDPVTRRTFFPFIFTLAGRLPGWC